MASKAHYTDLNGIVLVNKHEGSSSNYVLQKIRHLYQANKAGHTGCLDPFATGMLPVCFGDATKFGHYLLEANKSYQATGCLGIETSTADKTGEVLSVVEDFVVSPEALQAALRDFSGEIEQVPSMYSALKHQGKPLYSYARQGITITREARKIAIHALELLAFDGQSFQVHIECSKGTYVRNLIEDLGKHLGVGAHVTVLHRNYTSGFEQEPMYTLSELQNMSVEERLACLLPMDRAVLHFPALILNSEEQSALYQGRVLAKVGTELPGIYRLYNEQNVFQGLGELTEEGLLKAKRLLKK